MVASFKLLTILLIAAFVSGCATVRETYAADGRKAYTLNCSGTARGWDKCFSAAGDICKEAGYDVLDRNGEVASFAAIGGSSGSFGGSAVRTSERAMVVACKRT